MQGADTADGAVDFTNQKIPYGLIQLIERTGYHLFFSCKIPVFAINAPSNTMFADFVFPILLARPVAGTEMVSISVLSSGSFMRDESWRRRPFFFSRDWK